MKVMMMMISSFWIIFFSTIILFSRLPTVTSQLPYDTYSTATLSTLWINNDSRPTWLGYADNSSIRIILGSETAYVHVPLYACGFYSNDTRDSYLFAISIIQTTYDTPSPQVVWSANRNNPVGINSTLELTAGGDLVLKDGDGTLAWTTNTAGRSVARLNLTEMGNLVLLDANDSPVWQSFDHPTDCWLPGQTLKPGIDLTAGIYSVSVEGGELVASIQSDHRQVHYIAVTELNNQKSYDLIYTNIHEGIYYDTSSTLYQYIKLGTDGHLRVFELDSSIQESLSWHEVADIFTDYGLSECGHPLFCGPYGICTDGQCSCPNGTSFRPINDRYLNLGCSEVVPLTCNASDNHYLLDLDNVTYFGFKYDIVKTDMNRCKEACLKNCSCKAAIFNGDGACYMPSQIFSLLEKDPVVQNLESQIFKYSVSIKIQKAPPTVRSLGVGANSRNNSDQLGLILGSTLGVLLVAVVIGVFMHRRRRRRRFEEVEEDYLDHVPGMPTRFSFQELAIATNNFNKKLGEGGFGSVFEGSFNDGTRIAVKSLDGAGHIKKSFLAEVQSIGNIHHINLVRLIGFCAEKSHRLLVYAYMCNGSLERWIYCKSHDKMLEWKCRRNIILDIAKGLAYLHEDCLQKIIHLDIKPQNILLDDGFNAKLGDFGLSKLIDRGQSNVVTTMRGTPGYLAPEWLKSAITEKVDVYSFGVVILEIVCGRKIFDQSRAEEERHLPTLFMNKAEEGQWLDLVDKCCLDVESNVEKVEEMMQIAAWCLQSDPEKRPPMTMVIKILEGVKNVNVPKDMDYNFLISQIISKDTSRLLPSLLSGPR